MDSPVTLVAFSTAVTAFAKKLGLSGDWLILVCVITGGFYAYLTTYQPALMSSLSWLVLTVSASGNVSLVKDVAQTMGRPSGE